MVILRQILPRRGYPSNGFGVHKQTVQTFKQHASLEIAARLPVHNTLRAASSKLSTARKKMMYTLHIPLASAIY